MSKLTDRHFFNRQSIVEDLSAGFVLGIQSVPDGLAIGLLALVNPIYGLYGYMTGVFSGALFSNSVFMSIQVPGAMALIISGVPEITQSPDPNAPLFALAILTGLIMLVAGLLKLGALIRFVPNSVITGFVNAVAVLIILGQLDDFFGYNSVGGNRVVRMLDLIQNIEQSHLPTLMIGLLTIILILTLEKTPLKALGMVVAIIFASLAAQFMGADSIALVRDIAAIPKALPLPLLPPLSVIPGLIIPALSLAFVGFVQGSSISQSIPNPDGKYPDVSQDFVGQGIASIVSGLFRGMPVAGSLSATSLVTNAGARSRLANISAGITIALCILFFSRWVGMIAMPVLAGLLIVIGFRTLKLGRVMTVWKTGWTQRLVMLATFIPALFLPLHYAVLIGVGLAILLFVLHESNKITVKAWELGPGRFPVEGEPPAVVPPQKVTVLVPYGSLFFAAAPTFNNQLPEVTATSRHAVVILVMRGRQEVGSTFLEVVKRYTDTLHQQGSKLMLTGIDPHIKEQFERTGIIHSIGTENIFLLDANIGMALQDAVDAAELWIGEQLANSQTEVKQP